MNIYITLIINPEMERIEGFVESVEKDIVAGKSRIIGFIIKGEIFEEVWGRDKKSIGFVNGDMAYDNKRNYLGRAVYYKNP